MPTVPERPGGFVLAELIVVLVVSAIVMAALLTALVALVRGMQPAAVTYQGEPLPIAPTFGAFPSAVRLHQILAERLGAARGVYVLGGRHLAIPTTDPAALVQPLQSQQLPAITDFSPGLPLDAKAFYDAYAMRLGPPEATAGADDFSVVVVGADAGKLAVTAFAQVRSHAIIVAYGGATSETFVVREVKLWDLEAGLLRYAFAEKPAQTGGLFTGAMHTWMRYQAGTVAEEGPACLVFPDPWVYAGARGQPSDIPPFSRFSYLCAVSP